MPRPGDGSLRIFASSFAPNTSTESRSTFLTSIPGARRTSSAITPPDLNWRFSFATCWKDVLHPKHTKRLPTLHGPRSSRPTTTRLLSRLISRWEARDGKKRSVFQFSNDYNIHNNANVHILKLHGSIDQIHHKDNILVLTTKDLTDTHAARMSMLSNIPRLLLDYYWVFIGYSFTDGILRQLLAEVRKSNRDVMPRASFALLPKVTDEDKEFFEQFKIQIIAGTMAPFMAAVQAQIDRQAAGKQRIRRIPDLVQTGGHDLTFPPPTRIAMDDQFEFVGPTDPDFDASAFLLGGEPSWANLAAAVDFRRDQLTDDIKSMVVDRLREAPTRGLIISGAAGSGKSTVLRRVGFEVTTDREDPHPVILLRDFYSSGNRYAETWDWRLISDVSKAADGRPVLILVDNVEVHHRMVRNLFSDLRSHNVPAVILGAVRSLDWSNIIEDHPMPGFGLVGVPDDLAEDEVESFVNYLARRRLLQVDDITTAAYWRERVRGHHEHHLLGVMRSLSAEAEEHFDQKILSEYGNLPDLGRRAYETICLVYRFGHAMPLDLLLIVLNCSEPTFGENVLDKDRDRVIISAASTFSGRIAFRARHRVIAEIVSGHVWSTQYELCDALTRIIDAMNRIRRMTSAFAGRSSLATRFGTCFRISLIGDAYSSLRWLFIRLKPCCTSNTR